MTPLFHVPKPPLNYLPRPDQLEPLVALLLSKRPEAVGVVGVQGMGGIGKSVLAAAAASEKRLHTRFKDGIYWLTVGQSPDMVAIQRQLARDLGVPLGEIQFLDASLGRSELENRLAGKAVLLVLDDVWQMEHAEQLNVVSPPGRVLITTRNQSVLQGLGAAMHRVDLLSLDESLELLADWAGQKRQSLPPEAAEVARECGYLPLALAMVGALIQRRPTAWPDALARLRQHDLAKLQTQFAGYKHPDLLRAIQTSVDGLDDHRLTSRFGRDVHQRYLELAVFPEDEPIPETALAVLWGVAGLDEGDVRDLMEELTARSLAQRSGTAPGVRRQSGKKVVGSRQDDRCSSQSREPGNALRLHDLQVDYLLAACGDIPRLHGQFVDAYHARCPAGFGNGPDDGYYFQHLAYHLTRANRGAVLRQLLCDADWLKARLAATDTAALIDDFRWIEQVAAPPDRAHRDHNPPCATEGRPRMRGSERCGFRSPGRDMRDLLALRDAIRLSAHVLASDTAQFAGQLRGRLDSGEFPTLSSLLTRMGEPSDKHFLSPMSCSLHPPGTALLCTLQGHTDDVRAVAVTPDGGRAISACDDHTLRVWDLDTGRTLRVLKGHRDCVKCVSVISDGQRAVSGSDDCTLRLWDLDTGATLCLLERHVESVNAVAVTPDGRRAISASNDKTLRIWNLDSTSQVHVLQGHSEEVTSVAVMPDGRHAVSGSGDKTLRVWDLNSGRAVRTLRGHSHWVNAVAVSPDGRKAISASYDQTLRVWDLESGGTVRVLKGHSEEVTSVAMTPDGRNAISGSGDQTLRVWDLKTGRTLRTLEGHSAGVDALVVTPDGRRVISAASNEPLRVWNLDTRETGRTLDRHSSVVCALTVTPDGRQAISASFDQTLRVWDMITGRTVHTLHGHSGIVTAVAVTPDSRSLVSASPDETLRVWDLDTGKMVHTLLGHSDAIGCNYRGSPHAKRSRRRLCVPGWDAAGMGFEDGKDDPQPPRAYIRRHRGSCDAGRPTCDLRIRRFDPSRMESENRRDRGYTPGA